MGQDWPGGLRKRLFRSCSCSRRWVRAGVSIDQSQEGVASLPYRSQSSLIQGFDSCYSLHTCGCSQPTFPRCRMACYRIPFPVQKRIRHRPGSLVSLGRFVGPARPCRWKTGLSCLVRHRPGERSGFAGPAGGGQRCLVRHLLGERSHFARPAGGGHRWL